MLRSLLFFPCTLMVSLALGQSVLSPSDFLGYESGSYFSRHHQIVDYYEQLEQNAGNMVKVEEYGRTDENRKLIMTFISTAENMARLEEIRLAHETGENEEVAIVWLGYNVHGNESSGSEASMHTAYELLTKHQDWLKNIVVIIDPCLNPDGRDRYVNWYNQKKNSNQDVNASSAEHDEPWPSGRFNHYLFDLNRDWAWLTQKETRQRLPVFNSWLPHIHADFHEMGMNSPYYFAPAAKPFHESITTWQREFQLGLGKNHAKYFDKNGWLYYTKEIFDLVYPGFGDTYPTFNGAIGLTYEQGGSGRAGLAVTTDEGDTLSLKDRMLHHHTVGISTVEFAFLNREKLIKEYQTFVEKKKFNYNGYVIWGEQERIRLLTNLLDLHEIEYTIGDGQKVTGYDYFKGGTGSVQTTKDHLLISANQKKGTLINVLFEPETYFEDSLTYDITSWSLPYAYGLECIASEASVSGKPPEEAVSVLQTSQDVYAYLIRWNSMSGAKTLTKLLEMGVRVRYAEEAFTFGEEAYNAGTLILLNAENKGKNLEKTLETVCAENGIIYTTTSTGMVDSGKDFGSGSVKLVDQLSVGMITNQGRPEREGEVWHFFEKDLKYPLTLINAKHFTVAKLEKLDVLILPSGGFVIEDSLVADWVHKGGKLIAIGEALNNFQKDTTTFQLKLKDPKKEVDGKKDDYANAHVHYSERDRIRIKDKIQGAIYKCKVDPTHPLAFGCGSEYFTLKERPQAYNLFKDGQNVVYLEGNAKARAGLVGSDVKKKQGNSVIFGVENMGKGSIVYMVDNPIFRGFWENGKLFMVNAIFFVN